MHDLTKPLADRLPSAPSESKPIRAGTNFATHQWLTLEQMLFVPPTSRVPPSPLRFFGPPGMGLLAVTRPSCRNRG
jgi:hypothetical protein